MGSVYNSAATLPIGSTSLNISGVLYVVEGDLAPERPTREIRRNDVNGDRSDFQLRTEPGKLSVTLQRATTSTNANGPNLGDNTMQAFSVNWVVTLCKPRQPQGDFHRYDVQFVAETLTSY